MTRSVCKLAIVGASARAAAFSAIRAGYEVVAADLFADADLQRVANATRIENYPEGLADWLATAECDAWMYTGALENHSALVDRMATIKPLVGNDGQTLRRVRDPLRMQAVCAAAGIAMPETLRSPDALPLDGSWLCKTYRGASGSGVWALDSASARERAQREGAVFQRHANGTPAAAIYVVSRLHAKLLGVSRQMMSPAVGRGWQYSGSMGPLPVSQRIAAQLETIGESLALDWRLCGIVGVDLILDDQSAWLIEVNPRYTASVEVVERFCSVHAIAAHIAACQQTASPDADAGKRLDFAPNKSQTNGTTHAKTILYARRDIEISPTLFDWMIERATVDLLHCSVADIPHAGEIIPEGRPVITVFASGASEDECQRQLDQWLAEVEGRLYDKSGRTSARTGG
jgi:predicted ATP-grasp superfamily ATP-dependent carboligase